MRSQNNDTAELSATTNSKDRGDRITRCPHDPENPYLTVTKKLVDDPSISMECAYLLMKLLAKPKDLDIRVSQLVRELEGRAGKKKIYKLINEAIKAGYMQREYIIRRGIVLSLCRKTTGGFGLPPTEPTNDEDRLTAQVFKGC